MGLTVQNLFIYPVKGLGGIELDQAEAESRGFKHDRRWMIVNKSGRFLSQRQIPKMAQIKPKIEGDSLILQSPYSSLQIKRSLEGPPIPVSVWKSDLTAPTVSPYADQWLSTLLGEPVRLVKMTPDVKRQISLSHSQPGEYVSFADAFPILIVNQASLDDLGHRASQTIPSSRFRPSIVVAGAEPWAEDEWTQLIAGDLKIRITKPCLRCQVPTIDQLTGNRTGPEPIRTLETFRKSGDSVSFGVYGIPVTSDPAGSMVVSQGDACQAAAS